MCVCVCLVSSVCRVSCHARRITRLENKRTGVVSSRPGWGVEESIENWDGVYLDTDDRVVALDVDGDPTNRQAVLIGKRGGSRSVDATGRELGDILRVRDAMERQKFTKYTGGVDR